MPIDITTYMISNPIILRLITSYHVISNLFRQDLEAIKSPASKLEPTGLLVKWKVAHLTQKIKKST